ncbi:hypothetical protein [Variovorax sp. W2I14]|uniref:hypothetical protein n=1 Tax=Variovorax sp. W2I14 TaxID=3042290 RepID=UPI003D23D350
MDKQQSLKVLSEARVFLGMLDEIISRAESLSDEDLSQIQRIGDSSFVELQRALNHDSTRAPRILFNLECAMDQINKIKAAPSWGEK